MPIPIESSWISRFNPQLWGYLQSHPFPTADESSILPRRRGILHPHPSSRGSATASAHHGQLSPRWPGPAGAPTEPFKIGLVEQRFPMQPSPAS